MSTQTKPNHVIRDHLLSLKDDFYGDVLETLPSLLHPAIRLEVLVLMKHRIQTGVWEYPVDEEREPEIMLNWSISKSDLEEIAKIQLSEVKKWLSELEDFLLNDVPLDQMESHLPLTSGLIINEYESLVKKSVEIGVEYYLEKFAFPQTSTEEKKSVH